MTTKDDEKRVFLELAERAFADLQRQKEAAQAKTIGALWDLWIPGIVAAGRSAHRKSHRRYLALECQLPDGTKFRPVDLRWSDFDRAHVDAWLAALREAPTSRGGLLTPASRDQVRLSLQSCFSHHLKHTKFVTDNPLRDVPREDKDPPKRRGYFTAESLAAFLKECRPMLRTMLRLSARCGGLRPTAVRLLTKDQIDLEAGELIFENKGGKERRVLVTSDMMEEIKGWAKMSTGRRVFPNPNDPSCNTPIPERTLSRWVQKAAIASGVTLMGERATWMHARHGFAMAMAAVAPLSWVADQMGHTTTKQVESRYGRLRGDAKEQMREWMDESPLASPTKKPK